MILCWQIVLNGVETPNSLLPANIPLQIAWVSRFLSSNGVNADPIEHLDILVRNSPSLFCPGSSGGAYNLSPGIVGSLVKYHTLCKIVLLSLVWGEFLNTDSTALSVKLVSSVWFVVPLHWGRRKRLGNESYFIYINDTLGIIIIIIIYLVS